jgi:hypothetical protein
MVRTKSTVIGTAVFNGGVIAIRHFRGLDEDLTAAAVVHVVRDEDTLKAMLWATFEHVHVVFLEDDLGIDAAIAGGANGDGRVVKEIRSNASRHVCP